MNYLNINHKLLQIWLLIFMLGLSVFTGSARTVAVYDELCQGFQTPPAQARPKVYWWWLNGNVDVHRMQEEIRSFHDAGISGFDIFEVGYRKGDTEIEPGPAFLSDDSLKYIGIALQEAAKFNMEVGLNVASSWNAGGSWITPEHAAKSIYFSTSKLDGSLAGKTKLPFPEISEFDERGRKRVISFGPDGKPVFYEEIAVLARPVDSGVNARIDSGSVVDVSRFFDPETEELDWHQDGTWEILRYICSNSGEQLKIPSTHSAGPIVDHFDAASTEAHFMYIINRLNTIEENLSESPLKSFYLASYEASGFVWTTSLPSEFKKINGYEVFQYLPALFDENAFTPEATARFKADFSKTLSELMINNFYKKAKDVSNKYGLQINSEAGGPGLPIHNVPAEPLKALGALDRPRGEFWVDHYRYNDEGIDITRVVKEVSAASHIYNRRIVEEEAFTSFFNWREGPFDLKPYGDRAFCEGMNRVVVHGSTHNPSGAGLPGITYHAGTHYNDKRIWWPKVRPFNDYLSRISYIFQNAEFYADVLYYYGDKIPNYAGHKNGRFMVGPGYDYEIVNTEVLKQLTVQNNRIFLPNGAQFNLLYLEDEGEIEKEVLFKLDELIKKGAVIVGTKPGSQDRVDTDLIDALWNPRKKNHVLQGGSLPRQLDAMGVGIDFSYPGKEMNFLDFIHYKVSDLDFYFIRNTTGERLSRNCSFRQSGRVPEIWHPENGHIIPCSVFEQNKGCVDIPLTFAPFESKFVVFKEGVSSAHYTAINSTKQDPPFMEYTDAGICIWEDGIFQLKDGDHSKPVDNRIKTQPLDGVWELFFPEGWGTPGQLTLSELTSWTHSKIDGVKYFSGIATYKKRFQYDINACTAEGHKLYLDLGDLSQVGDVWLNGEHLGITWAKPHRFDVTGIVHTGLNFLEVEVANSWSNRLVGDAVTGIKYTKTNQITSDVYGLGDFDVPWADVPLIESGLFGPVRLLTIIPVK